MGRITGLTWRISPRTCCGGCRTCWSSCPAAASPEATGGRPHQSRPPKRQVFKKKRGRSNPVEISMRASPTLGIQSYCHPLPSIATHCNPLQPIAAHCSPLQPIATHRNPFQTHCNPLQPIATHCYILQPIATHSKPIATTQSNVKTRSVQ